MKKNHIEARSTPLALLLAFSVSLLGILSFGAVDASNPYAVKVTDTNGNLMNAGVMNDVWSNYSSLQSSLSNSYFQTNTVPATNGVFKCYTNTAYAYFKAGSQSTGLGVSTPKLHQALQTWFSYTGTDGGCFPYTLTYVSLRGVKRVITVGDSLTQGTGATATFLNTNTGVYAWNEGPCGGTGLGDYVDQLGETYPNWAVIPSINQGHGGAQLHGNIDGKINAEVLAYAPTSAQERVIVLFFCGTNDLTIGGRTGAQLITDVTSYITALHAASSNFYVVLMNIPREAPDTGTSIIWGTAGGSTDIQRQYFNANYTSCGADIVCDISTTLSNKTIYYNSSNGHFNDAGYSALASNINFVVPNP